MQLFQFHIVGHEPIELADCATNMPVNPTGRNQCVNKRCLYQLLFSAWSLWVGNRCIRFAHAAHLSWTADHSLKGYHYASESETFLVCPLWYEMVQPYSLRKNCFVLSCFSCRIKTVQLFHFPSLLRHSFWLSKVIVSRHIFFSKISRHIFLITLHMSHPYTCVDCVKDTQVDSLYLSKSIYFSKG